MERKGTDQVLHVINISVRKVINISIGRVISLSIGKVGKDGGYVRRNE